MSRLAMPDQLVPATSQLPVSVYFDQALFDLYEAGRVSYEDALRNADSINDLRLQIKLHGKESKDRDLTSGIGHLDIV